MLLLGVLSNCQVSDIATPCVPSDVIDVSGPVSAVSLCKAMEVSVDFANFPNAHSLEAGIPLTNSSEYSVSVN